MKTLSAAACGAALLALSFTAAAQSYSPSGNYTAPGAGTVGFEAKKKSGPCPDPWVTMAQEVVYGSARADRCNPALYNGGRWGSYNELVHAMAKVKGGGAKTAQPAGPMIDLNVVKYNDGGNGKLNLFSNNGIAIGYLQAGRITVSLPPNMVAAGGGNMVAAGGGNMVAAGGGNMVAAGGGNVIAAVEQALGRNPPVAPMSGYSLQGVQRLNDLKAAKR